MLTREENSEFFGHVYDLFFEFAQKKPESVRILFSREIEFPVIVRFPELSIKIPLPRFNSGVYRFQGFVFEDTPEQRCNLWALFLASVYHIASHVAVSNYSIYEKWIKNKTEDVYAKVIDFIEDFFVEKYISRTDPEIWKAMNEINARLNCFCGEGSPLVKGDASLLPQACAAKDEDILSKINASLELAEKNSDEKLRLEAAEILYKNRQLLPKTTPSYCEHGSDDEIMELERRAINLDLDQIFKEMAYTLDELWAVNEEAGRRLLGKYRKHLKGLQFDSVALSPENLYGFLHAREVILPMVRRIRQQLRTVVNVTDSPKADTIGLVDMQMAIQAVASQGRLTEIYEQVEDRRAEEAWVILIDKSASMRLRFDHIKEFAICVAEAANELTGRHDAWGMYSFDNNFQIIKDFSERYGRKVQARLGGLRNSGLSLLPDAIELSYRILVSDQREKKFLFVITDGHPSGYDRIQEQFSKIAKKVEVSGVVLVAIGVSKATSKKFRNNARGTDLKQLVAKFITAYRAASSDM